MSFLNKKILGHLIVSNSFYTNNHISCCFRNKKSWLKQTINEYIHGKKHIDIKHYDYKKNCFSNARKCDV